MLGNCKIMHDHVSDNSFVEICIVYQNVNCVLTFCVCSKTNFSFFDDVGVLSQYETSIPIDAREIIL